jgi:ABC-type multidrug transport system fused ATPase/permease subunit
MKNNIKKETFSYFVRYVLKEYPVQIGILVISSTLVAFIGGISITLVIPFLGEIIGNTQELVGGGSIAQFLSRVFIILGLDINIKNILIIFLFLILLQVTFSQFNQYYTSKVHVNFSKKLSIDLLRSYLDASLSYFYSTKVGKLVNNVTIECDRASNTLTLFSYLLRETCLAFIYLLLPIFISWKLSIFAISLGIISALMVKKLHILAEQYGEGLTRKNIEVQSEVSEKLSGIKDVKSGYSEPMVYEGFLRAISKKLHYRYKSMVNAALVTNVQIFFGGIIMSVVILVSVYYIKLGFSDLILFLASFQRLIPRITAMQRWYNEIFVTLPSLWLIFSTIEEIRSSKEIIKPDQIELNNIDQDIVFENVSFHYETDSRKFNLSNINLTIQYKKITAIVGRSGSGKSTIVDILLGFNKLDQGRVMINGYSLDHFNIKSIRRHIGYVSQESVLFNDSIKNNICWYSPNASNEKINNAARIANVDDFIVSLPEKYDTVVGDRGVKLSGGQKQRIILARNILTNPCILILDEATSNLDYESEDLILNAIKLLSEQMTIVIITHRISTTKISDYIYHIKDGKVIEIGTWESLNYEGTEFKQLSDTS